MSIAQRLLAEGLPVNELIAKALNVCKFADQAVDSTAAELTFSDGSAVRVVVEIVETEKG